MILHPDFRIDVETTLSALSAAYPQVPSPRLELYQPLPGDRSLGRAERDAILLNSYWFSRSRADFDAAVLEARGATLPGIPLWHGGIGGQAHEVERFLTHEFGHLLSDTLPGFRKFAFKQWKSAIDTPDVAVSGYALLDPDEWFAETFAAYRLGGSGSVQVGHLAGYLAQQGGRR